MSGIVCAIRGGPSSQLTIERAIQLAKDTDLPLLFLYVVNLAFLSYTESSRTRVIYEEMDGMGDFILFAAQEKAKAQEITAEAIVRHGEVIEQIIALVKEVNAEYIVLGQPEGEKEKDVFTKDRMELFGKMLSEESGAQVVVAAGEEE